MKSRLSTLPRHASAIITEVVPTQDSERLKSVGFVPGTKIEVQKTGRNLLVKLPGTAFMLSSNLAESIIVSSDK